MPGYKRKLRYANMYKQEIITAIKKSCIINESDLINYNYFPVYPCVVFLSAKKPMRVVDGKRITKVEKVTSFPVLLGLSFINCGRLDLRINQHRTPDREKTYVNLRRTGMSMTNTLKNCLISFRKIVI